MWILSCSGSPIQLIVLITTYWHCKDGCRLSLSSVSSIRLSISPRTSSTRKKRGSKSVLMAPSCDNLSSPIVYELPSEFHHEFAWIIQSPSLLSPSLRQTKFQQVLLNHLATFDDSIATTRSEMISSFEIGRWSFILAHICSRMTVKNSSSTSKKPSNSHWRIPKNLSLFDISLQLFKQVLPESPLMSHDYKESSRRRRRRKNPNNLEESLDIPINPAKEKKILSSNRLLNIVG